MIPWEQISLLQPARIHRGFCLASVNKRDALAESQTTSSFTFPWCPNPCTSSMAVQGKPLNIHLCWNVCVLKWTPQVHTHTQTQQVWDYDWLPISHRSLPCSYTGKLWHRDGLAGPCMCVWAVYACSVKIDDLHHSVCALILWFTEEDHWEEQNTTRHVHAHNPPF